jgi:hypothetical protein
MIPRPVGLLPPGAEFLSDRMDGIAGQELCGSREHNLFFHPDMFCVEAFQALCDC